MGFNKEYRAELQGMSYAYRYAKEHGIEELEKEMKRRGAMEVTTKIPRSVVKKAEEQISATTIQTVCLLAIVCIHDCFGIGPKRMQDFMDKFAIRTQCLLDGDVFWEDIQEQAMKELGMDINISELVSGRRYQQALKRQDEKIVQIMANVEENNKKEAGGTDNETEVEQK